MRGRLLLVRDDLEGAAPWIGQLLRQAELNVLLVSRAELAHHTPADAVLLSIRDRDPVAACWALHRQGHRSVVAISTAATTKECIRLLNAGADYYLDAWLPAAEFVARVKVVLRFASWLDQRAVPLSAS